MDKANKKPRPRTYRHYYNCRYTLFCNRRCAQSESDGQDPRRPTDKERKLMAYNDNYRSLSENVLERDGIILRADGDELMFYALAGR